MRAILAGIILLILFSPLPFGSVQPWAVVTMQLSVVALVGVWALDRTAGRLPRERTFVVVVVSGILILVIGGLQLIPMPVGVQSELVPPTADARARVAAVVPEIRTASRPLSLDPAETLDALLRFSMYLALGVLAVVSLRGRTRLMWAAGAIALSGAFQGFYGALEYLTGHQHIFWYAKKHFVDEASGTFINRNHFCSYLAASLPFALALAAIGSKKLTLRGSLPERIARMSGGSAYALLFGTVSAILVWLGVLLSYSRSGLVAAVVATGCFVSLVGSTKRRLILLVFALFLLPTAYMAVQEVRAPGERFFSGAEAISTGGSRVLVWHASSGIVRDYPWLGSGLGTFESVFNLYKPATVSKIWDHAHSDWLELLVDAGPVGLLAVLSIVVMLGFRARSVAGRRPVAEELRAAAYSSLLAIAVHSLTDFPLRIPAVAALSAIVMAIAWNAGAPVESEAGVLHRNGIAAVARKTLESM